MTVRNSSIQRVNFIEQDRFVLTYGRMLNFTGAVVGFCLLLGGLQWARIAYADRQLSRLETEVKVLREERDRISKQISTLQGEMSARDFLSNLFERTPPWTAVLKELVALMPRSLWLTGFQAPERTDVSAPMVVQLSGRADEAVSIARFLKALNASSFFNSVILNSSQQEEASIGTGYSFAIHLSLSPVKGKGL